MNVLILPIGLTPKSSQWTCALIFVYVMQFPKYPIKISIFCELPNTKATVGANSCLGLFVVCVVGHELAPVHLLDVPLELVDGAERAVAKVANRVARVDGHVVPKRLYQTELLVADEALELRIVLDLQPRPIWKQLGIGQCRLEGDSHVF